MGSIHEEIKNKSSYFQNALSLLFYDYEDCPDKIIEIFEQCFDEAVEFVFESSSYDRSSDKEQFKKMLLEKFLLLIQEKITKC